jgi:ATP-dependent DNA helicase RecG
MALPINTQDLLNKRKVESNRIEFKKGWNPVSIYHSVCAFANDFDDLGGGYIVVGVDTEVKTGLAIRPVEGVPIEKIDGILQEMVGYNNKMSPYYMPRTSVEEVDGKQVLVIWCPAGINRPYSVPENVTSKASKEYFYVRSGTSSIVAKGEVLDELRELASRVPFDERGNPDIKLSDISTLLLREYLVKVNSKLASDLYTKPLDEILEQMDLFVGPTERRMLRNVSAMMFCETPDKFFKHTQVEIVFFPEGRLNNPNNIYEGPVVTGSVPQIIERTLEYLNRMLVMQTVSKPNDNNHSKKFFTYPYQALEESVTNSLYHRDYREWEPVVITVEPQSITIQNIGGPDRSISSDDISKGELLVSKRYRNRRLGEYLKELDMTEGRNTGIPTIQNELKSNGSHRAVVTTDEDRTFFRITIPCHEAAGNIISDIAKKDGSPISSLTSSQKSSQKSSQEIIELITQNPKITLSELANMLKMTRRGIDKNIKKLKEQGVIRRVGPDKGGHWEVVAG